MLLPFQPLTNFFAGLRSFPRGVRWLVDHPFWCFVLLIPVIVSCMLLFLGLGLFMTYADEVHAWILFTKPDSMLLQPLYWVAKLFLYIIVIIVGLLAFMLSINILAAPIYEFLSVAVEKDLLGVDKVEEIGLWASLLLVKEELKKAIFIAAVTFGLLLIPGVNLLSPFLAAFFIGWDFYDYPLARRGWSFKRRLGFVFSHFWSVMGFGLWLVIPGLQLLFMPLAVTGGTMLAIRDLGEPKKKETDN